jgi:hypothetical protein
MEQDLKSSKSIEEAICRLSDIADDGLAMGRLLGTETMNLTWCGWKKLKLIGKIMNSKDRDQDDYMDYPGNIVKEEYERDNTGGDVKVSHYRDGSTRYHHGGPGGHQDYDKYGREC